MEKPVAPSCERNREPILAVLQEHLADRQHVLEVGAGTGQHAVYFAAQLPQLLWQCSDRAENVPGIRLWLDEAGLPNTPEPIAFDVSAAWPSGRYDAVFSANTLHIMSWDEVRQFFAGLPLVTTQGAKLIIYGPFNDNGQFTSESNAQFDAWLKARGAHMGIRDAAAVDALAAQAGFALTHDLPMPANNRCRIWQRA